MHEVELRNLRAGDAVDGPRQEVKVLQEQEQSDGDEYAERDDNLFLFVVRFLERLALRFFQPLFPVLEFVGQLLYQQTAQPHNDGGDEHRDDVSPRRQDVKRP